MNKDLKQEVAKICERIHGDVSQIVIDLVQDDVESLLEADDVTPDEISAQSYRVSLLFEVMDPSRENEREILHDLIKALDDWAEDKTFVNKSLGLDPNE